MTGTPNHAEDPAVEAMIEAIQAEFDRQYERHPNGPYTDGELSDVIIIDGELHMPDLARAVLAAATAQASRWAGRALISAKRQGAWATLTVSVPAECVDSLPHPALVEIARMALSDEEPQPTIGSEADDAAWGGAVKAASEFEALGIMALEPAQGEHVDSAEGHALLRAAALLRVQAARIAALEEERDAALASKGGDNG